MVFTNCSTWELRNNLEVKSAKRAAEQRNLKFTRNGSDDTAPNIRHVKSGIEGLAPHYELTLVSTELGGNVVVSGDFVTPKDHYEIKNLASAPERVYMMKFSEDYKKKLDGLCHR